RRVIGVPSGLIRAQIAGAELAARPETALGPFRLDLQLVRDTIRPADTSTSVVVPVTTLRDGVLNEGVRAPCGQRAVPQLRHHICSLALLLCRRHGRRVVLPVVPSDTGAHAPVLARLVGVVERRALGLS